MARKIIKTEYLMKPIDWRLVAALIVLTAIALFVFNMMTTAPSVAPSGNCYSSGDCPSGYTCHIGAMQNTCVQPKCWDYCNGPGIAHIMCVGEWNVSGVYPNCHCQWLCTEGGPT